MLRVHTTDGLTTAFDLGDERQAKKWLEQLRDLEYQEQITGLTVSSRGVLYSLSRPLGFRQVSFYAENVEPDPIHKVKGGERLICFADDVRTSFMVHAAQRAIRVTLAKTGKQRFNPLLR